MTIDQEPQQPKYRPIVRPGEPTPPGCKPGKHDITFLETPSAEGGLPPDKRPQLESMLTLLYGQRQALPLQFWQNASYPKLFVAAYGSNFTRPDENREQYDNYWQNYSRFVDCARAEFHDAQRTQDIAGRTYRISWLTVDRVLLRTKRVFEDRKTTTVDVISLLRDAREGEQKEPGFMDVAEYLEVKTKSLNMGKYASPKRFIDKLLQSTDETVALAIAGVQNILR